MSVTNANHHVQAIIDLLDAAADTEWSTSTPPNIRNYWDDAQSERGPGADQPAVCYVWSPTDSTLERFSGDGDRFLQTNTAEVQIWSLDPQEPVGIQDDVTRILSGYLDDNETDTPYTDVAPVNESDFREQKSARRTDHYIMAVEVETTDLSETGLA